jgi:hypothetical protein
MTQAADVSRIRVVLGGFMVALVLSGLTAFPLQSELELVTDVLNLESSQNPAALWIVAIRNGLRASYARYPWLAYGTDWLAFAHVVIALFFVGPWLNPVRNVWVLWAGLLACGLVLPLALICGPIRLVPLGWRLIDCAFGIFGAVPLGYCLWLTHRIEAGQPEVPGPLAGRL